MFLFLHKTNSHSRIPTELEDLTKTSRYTKLKAWEQRQRQRQQGEESLKGRKRSSSLEIQRCRFANPKTSIGFPPDHHQVEEEEKNKGYSFCFVLPAWVIPFLADFCFLFANGATGKQRVVRAASKLWKSCCGYNCEGCSRSYSCCKRCCRSAPLLLVLFLSLSFSSKV